MVDGKGAEHVQAVTTGQLQGYDDMGLGLFYRVVRELKGGHERRALGRGANLKGRHNSCSSHNRVHSGVGHGCMTPLAPHCHIELCCSPHDGACTIAPSEVHLGSYGY